MANEFERSIRASNAIVQEIRPILAGESPEVVGAALAQLLAMFIAATPPPRRESVRVLLIECYDTLVPIYVDEMIKAGVLPQQWRVADAR